MSRIFWDTNIFIYFFEAKAGLGPVTRTLYERMFQRGDQRMTSAMALGEMLVKPIERGDTFLRKKYEIDMKAAWTILPFDLEAANHYAELRQNRGLKAPDAIQLACAAAAKVDLFITNDNRLHDLQVPGIQFIVPIDRVPI